MSDLVPPGGPVDRPGSDQPPAPPPPPLPSFNAYGGATAPYAVPPSSDKGLGWTGFGLAVVFCVPCLPLAGVVLAIIALARGRFQPRWIAALTLAIGTGATILQVAMVPSVLEDIRDSANESLERDADKARDSGEAREISILKLQKGDCFDSDALRGLAGDETVDTETVTLLPCERKHDLEVFKIIELPEGDYPGQAAIDRRAARCLEVFATFVGKPYGVSRFEVYYTFPREQSWRLLGDRNITCLAGHPRKKVSGSLRNRQR